MLPYARPLPADAPVSLGPYKLVGELGAGGFATVYRATVEGDFGFKRDVALKVLHPHVVEQEPQVVKMLADEARLLARMQHPNIVHVQWFGALPTPDGGERTALVMEFVDGRDLQEILEEAQAQGRFLPLATVVDLFRSIARALAYAHALQDDDGRPMHLVHRDLKPANVVVTKQGDVKLLDFGIAKAKGRIAPPTSASYVRGTVMYMSPEQVSGAKDLDARSDLFSVGAMLYEVVTGKRLISAPSMPAAVARLVNFRAEPAAEAVARRNPALGDIAYALLRYDRADRLASAQDLMDALSKARLRIDDPRTSTGVLQQLAVAGAESILEDSAASIHDDTAKWSPRDIVRDKAQLPQDRMDATRVLALGEGGLPWGWIALGAGGLLLAAGVLVLLAS